MKKILIVSGGGRPNGRSMAVLAAISAAMESHVSRKMISMQLFQRSKKQISLYLLHRCTSGHFHQRSKHSLNASIA